MIGAGQIGRGFIGMLLENISEDQPARYETVPFTVQLRESTK